MATITSWEEQVKNREADWKGMKEKRFRWSKFRMEWGRWCYITHPVEGVRDVSWWEWENE